MKGTTALLVLLALAACGKDAEVPPPVPIPPEAIGHFCNMTVSEHPGPKGQIVLKGQAQPVWFTSARDTIAFTLLPEEPKDIRAIYVNDMARSKSWEQPDAWVDARRAYFVIGSNRTGGMGMQETVPFSDKAAAEAFAHDNGGQVVDLKSIPQDYVLGQAGDSHAGH